MIRAWVKYGCGCMEGIWIDDGRVCNAFDLHGGRHKYPVVAYSDEVTLCPNNVVWIELRGGNEGK